MLPIDAARTNELHSDCLNVCLPSAYKTELDEESKEGLELALGGLRAAAAAGDLSRGANFHCSALRRHLALKHALSDAARVEVIEILYRLVTADVPVAHGVRRRWAVALCKLLRRAKHLDFVLPWRPLLSQLLLYSTSKLRIAQFASRSTASGHLTQLARCAAQCRRHFPDGSSALIMQAIEPLLCPKDPQFFTGAALLSLLLPTHGKEGAVWQDRMLTLWRGSGIEGCVEWEMLFMLLFKRLAKDAFVGKADPGIIEWSRLLPTVFSRTLLLLNLPGGTGQVHPKGSTFTTAASTLLPSAWPPPMSTLRAAARIIVLALTPLPRNPEHEPHPDLVQMADGNGPEATEAAAAVEAAMAAEADAEVAAAEAANAAAGGGGDSMAIVSRNIGEAGEAGLEASSVSGGATTWLRLRQLLRCAEPYCHPSNVGMWSSFIGYLLQALSQFVSWRALYERTNLAASSEHSLKPADISVLVRLLAPLATRALYSKAPQLMMMAQMACKYLAELAPEYVLPALQLRLCEGLQAVTAIHQTPMALQTLALFAPYLVDLSTSLSHALVPGQPELKSAGARRALAAGPRAMLEALQLAIPGIDPNDLDKMASTARFFLQLLLFVPVAGPRWADETGTAGALSPSELETLGLTSRQLTIQRLKSEGDDEGLAALEAQEDEARALCAWLPEFAEELIRKLVGALDYFDKSSESGGRDAFRQSLYLMQWRRTCQMLFQQLSEELLASNLPQLLALLSRPSLLDSVKYVGALLSAATWANPQLTLDRALPTCFAALLKGDKLQPLSESELRWWVTILSHLIRKAGSAVLPYLPQLKAVLRLTCTHTELQVMEASSKLRRHLLQSLLSIYLTESRSLPPRAWKSAAVREAPWQAWGWRPPIQPASARTEAVSAQWHEPSAEELTAAAEVLEETLAKAERLAKGVTEGTEAATSDELRGCIIELKAVAKGALPNLEDEPAEASGSGSGGTMFMHPRPAEGGEEEAAATDGDDPMDGSTTAPPPTDDKYPPRLRSVIPHAGKVSVPSGSCARPLSRLATVLAQLGAALATREAVRNLTLLMSVATLCVAERSAGKAVHQLKQMLHLGQRSCTVRGGGRPKHQPRAHLLGKIEVRHMQRLASTTFGFASRTPAFEELLRLQLSLSTHAYSSVRTEAQAGFATALRLHPWLARSSLFPQIKLLSSPSAQPHETKGAIFLLSTRAALKQTSSDFALLSSLLVGLVDARDHQKPKLQQRARNLFSALCDAVPAPLPGSKLMPLPPLGAEDAELLEQLRKFTGALPIAQLDAEAEAALVCHYERGAKRDANAIRRAADTLLLRMPNPAAGAGGSGHNGTETAPAPEKPAGGGGDGPSDGHWSREVGALCGLIVLPLTIEEQRAGLAARAARGLCSAHVAVRKLSRAALSMLLTRKRPKGSPVPQPVAAPADLFAPLPESDEAWEAIPMVDKLLAGWASDLAYTFPSSVPEDQLIQPLGPLADELLTDTSFLQHALQWLVADHKEADNAGEGGREMFRSASDVVLSLLSPSRRWPSQPGHGVEFKDFELRHAQLFKGLANKYGAAKMLPALLPHLQKLMGESASRDAQAVASETCAGLVRGAARWKLSEQRKLWADLGPSLKAALRNASVQSLGDWQACLRYMTFNRDPRRVSWLAELLVSEFESSAADRDPSPEGNGLSAGGEAAFGDGSSIPMSERSLIQANQLRFLAPLVVELGWKGLPLLRRLLRSEVLRSWVSHPMRQVRDEVGSLLAIAMDACAPLPARFVEVGEAIHTEIQAFLLHLGEACKVPEALQQLSSSNGSAVAATPPAEKSGGANGVGEIVEIVLEPEEEKARQKARAARETVLRCITHNGMQGRAFCSVDYSTSLLPAVMTAAAGVQPPDLSNAAKACALMIAHFPMHADRYAATVHAVASLASAGSWRLRGGLLPFVGLLAYRGQFIEPLEANTAALRAILHGLMCDPQHEVREAGAVVLAGFIRLHGPAERMRTLKWARQRTKKGRPHSERHAGVLALVALVQLAPYDVPSWLPEVIELLATFHNEPQPIKGAVSQAFSDFKRTHQDNWASHRERFTPEQQDLISDMLVSPSFYA